MQSQIRGDGQLKINAEWRTWDGLEFRGIVLLKSKVFGRKKIKGSKRETKNGYLCLRENLRFNDNYNLKELYNSIINISNISCQRQYTE